MKNQKGFSLIELLVVVIIIAIIAAIAIPSLLASRRAANEGSAISSMRNIHTAQVTYFSTVGANTNYATAMGDATVATSLEGAGLVDSQLGSGSKSGYDFVTTSSLDADGNGQYCASAEATTQDVTGTRSFSVGQLGVIYGYAAAGGAASCAAGVLTPGAGVAIE